MKSLFSQPIKKRQNCVWTTKYESLLEMGTVPHVETKSVFSFQPKKKTSFYSCGNGKACCHVLNIPSKDQKPTIMLFGSDRTRCFARKTSRDYEKPSPFLQKFLQQSQSPAPKKVTMSPNKE